MVLTLVHLLELLISLHFWHQRISLLTFLQELPFISKCVLKYFPSSLAHFIEDGFSLPLAEASIGSEVPTTCR